HRDLPSFPTRRSSDLDHRRRTVHMAAIGDLSLPALDILWYDLELGALPFPLEVRSHGDTVEERARLRGVVYEQLDRRGLGRGGQDRKSRRLNSSHVEI